MSKKIDRVLEEANVLLTTTKKFPTELAGVGITAEKVTNFETQIATVRQKDTTFNDSKNQKFLRSNEQKEVIANTLKLIERTKNAAKIAFIDDKPTLKAYMLAISSKTPVPKIISDLSYLKESATVHKELLIQAGLKQADFDELDTLLAGMIDSENKQEDAKHTQKAHLVELNTLAKEIPMLRDDVHLPQSRGYCPEPSGGNPASRCRGIQTGNVQEEFDENGDDYDRNDN